MNAQALRDVVASTSQRLSPDEVRRLEEVTQSSTPPDLVTAERMVLRKARLAEADVRPSRTAFERILGRNNLLDVNYLARAQQACRPVCRIILRNAAGREDGYGTGFLVAPGVLLTNHHVFPDAATAETAVAEFDYELDSRGLPRPTTRFAFDPRALFLADKTLDFALVALSAEPTFGTGHLSDYGFLRVDREPGKVNPGECVTIVQHPSGQPKQIALRENQLLQIDDLFLHYQSDTAQGSSGAPVLNDSWQLVALHHSGVPRRDSEGRWLLKNGTPVGDDEDVDDADIDWIANEGVRASKIALFVEDSGERGASMDAFLRASGGESPPATRLVSAPAPEAEASESAGVALSAHRTLNVQPVLGSAVVTVPLSFTIAVGAPVLAPPPVVPGSPAAPPAVDPPAAFAPETARVPYVDPDYDNRAGYDPDFLGLPLPLPSPTDTRRVARMPDGEHVLPYAHFSVVVDRVRRLALFTASNVDASLQARQPEPGRVYSRDGLSGLRPNDIEAWLTDPRLPEAHQLPDRFYSKDGGAFDKGHIVRRDDVCWGASYDEVRRANGDTFHTTNCSPQVAGYNRSNLGGAWGTLENEVLRQAAAERLTVFAGPVLADDDRSFLGRDHRGPVSVQIPHAFWKVVVARAGDRLDAFAFVLEQDLTNVSLEFDVARQWKPFVTSVADLEGRLRFVAFPPELHAADRAAEGDTERVLRDALGPH